VQVRLWVKSGRGTKEVYGIVQFFSVPAEVIGDTFVGDGDIVIKKCVPVSLVHYRLAPLVSPPNSYSPLIPSGPILGNYL
jgi:hypothetical protein